MDHKQLFTFTQFRLGLLICFSLIGLTKQSVLGQSVTFSERTAAAGIGPQRSEGIAVGDYDGDGFPDVYVTFAFGPNQLLRNDGNGGFTDVAAESGLALTEFDNTSTSAWGDFDNDGKLDLYIGCKQLPDRLFKNNGDGTFSNYGIPAGIGQIGWPKSINLADFNNDGWLDIYVSNFNFENVLLLNDGDGSFTDHTAASQALDNGTSMGVLCFDYGQDGDQDLLLIKDANQPTRLYENDGNGVFTEIAAAANIASESFGMGVDAADVNKDGWLDIYVTNLYGNFLFMAQPDGTFLETSVDAGVNDFGMGWGCSFLDLENDGLPDLYVANEYSFSPYENKLYRNNGDGTFADILNTEAVTNEYSSWGCMAIDQDMDGRQDLLSANRGLGESLQFFRNETSESGSYLKLRLSGLESNSMGIGAAVRLVDDQGEIHYAEVTAGSGWESQKSNVLHFGLGAATSLVEASVRWPSGLVQDISDIALNTAWTVTEGEGFEVGVADKVASTTYGPNQSLPEELIIAPNPWKSGSGLDINTATLPTIKTALFIHTMDGKAIYRTSLDPYELRSGSVAISASVRAKLPVGVYTLSLKNADGIRSRRIVIQ
ncbi:hypothetical protein CEQ90_14130 [Lewinellaceae bacterium SD302]|nr:hypothetical protein CEQ90_14130 [Lewinellaceae bacterium SD302]